jgi:hypothetical protein
MTAQTQRGVFASGQIDISAEPQQVWSIMVGVENWPDWNHDVKWARLAGPLAEGTEFMWKAGPGTIRSKLQLVDEPRAVSWEGRTLGIQAYHSWRLEPSALGTMVMTEESWTGFLPSLLPSAMNRQLKAAIDRGLGFLKEASEA